jgi:hypothetical protein
MSTTTDDLETAKHMWAECEKKKQDVRETMKPLLDAMKEIKSEQNPFLEILAEHMDSTGITEMAAGGWIIRRKSSKRKSFTEDFLNANMSPEQVKSLKDLQEPATSMSITKAATTQTNADGTTQVKKRRRASVA